MHNYRLLVISGYIVAQWFSGRWYTLSKSREASVDGSAIWKDSPANRKRAEKLFNGSYQTVQAPCLWEAQLGSQGWLACTGTDYLPEGFASAKEAVQALAQLIED